MRMNVKTVCKLVKLFVHACYKSLLMVSCRWERYQTEEEAALGRGKRQRKAVSYREAYVAHPSEALNEVLPLSLSLCFPLWAPLFCREPINICVCLSICLQLRLWNLHLCSKYMQVQDIHLQFKRLKQNFAHYSEL